MLATAVESSTLASVAYHPSTQQLWLEFRSHALYCYFGVPPAVHQGLMNASSKGAYFNRNIRGHFPYLRDADRGPHPTTQSGPEPHPDQHFTAATS